MATLDISQPQNGGTSFGGWRGLHHRRRRIQPVLQLRPVSGGHCRHERTKFCPARASPWSIRRPLLLLNFITSGDQSDVNAIGDPGPPGGSRVRALRVEHRDRVRTALGALRPVLPATLDFPGLPSIVTFSGLRYVGTLNAYEDPDAHCANGVLATLTSPSPPDFGVDRRRTVPEAAATWAPLHDPGLRRSRRAPARRRARRQSAAPRRPVQADGRSSRTAGFAAWQPVEGVLGAGC